MRKKFAKFSFIFALSIALLHTGTHNVYTVQAANCSHAVVDASGNCTSCTETGLDLCKLNGTTYTSLDAAITAAADNSTIQLLRDCTDSSKELDCNPSSVYKDLTIDLNGHKLILQTIKTQKALSLHNGTYIGKIDNAAPGTSSALTLLNTNVELTDLQWMSNGGVVLTNSSLLLNGASSVWLEDLAMDDYSTFTLKNCNSGISNYGNIPTDSAFADVLRYLPQGYALVRTSSNTNTIVDENGNPAKSFTFKYKTLSDVTVTFHPEKFVYDGTKHTPAITVTYEDVQLQENRDYTYKITNNINAGKATVEITGKGVYHERVTKKFTIDKATQKAPAGLTAQSESAKGKKDGVIKNVNANMEYSTDNSTWTKVKNTKINGLSKGTYYVRFAETKNYLASPSVKVTVDLAKNSKATLNDNETKPEKNETSVPRTGDHSNYVLWLFLFTMSVACMLIALKSKIKWNDN